MGMNSVQLHTYVCVTYYVGKGKIHFRLGS